jgi:multiple sugar transport system ATP-binding protein
VAFADYKVPVPAEAISQRPGLEGFFDRQVIIGIRPSSFEDAAFVADGRPVVKAEVTVSEELGSEVNVIFTVHAPPVQHEVMVAKFDKAAKDEVEAGELVGAGDSLWTARVNPKTQARPGRTIDLAIDAASLHYFDPDTGHAISHHDATSGSRPMATTGP